MHKYGAVALALLALPFGAAQGATPFATTCAACHGQNAEGVPGFAPPLENADLWTSLGDKAPDYLAGVMIAGLSGQIESGGQVFVGAMPAQAQLSDEDLLAIAQYILNEVNGLEVTLTPETLAEKRASPPTHEALLELRAGGQ